MENQGKINENGNNQNVKQVTLKNKKIITILILLVVFIILTTISYSLFTDTKNEEKNLWNLKIYKICKRCICSRFRCICSYKMHTNYTIF